MLTTEGRTSLTTGANPSRFVTAGPRLSATFNFTGGFAGAAVRADCAHVNPAITSASPALITATLLRCQKTRIPTSRELVDRAAAAAPVAPEPWSYCRIG